jgi:hypothetical protein
LLALGELRGNEMEPSYGALDRLRSVLKDHGGVMDEGSVRYIDGEPWVLCSPELMLQLIEERDEAVRAVQA